MTGNEKKGRLSQLKSLYARAFASSLGDGMVSPFLYVYAVRLGSSPGEIGWMYSLNNLFTYTFQVPWGRISDRLGRSVTIVILASLAASLLWIPIIFITEPKSLIFLLSFRCILTSASTPAWNALLGELIPLTVRGTTISIINAFASMGGLIATAISGPLIDGSAGNMTVPLSAASILGSLGAFALLSIREREVRKPSKDVSLMSLLGTSDIPRLIREDTDFKLFLKLSIVQGFFFSFAWPLFSITMAETLNLSMSQVGAISIISTSVTLLSQPLIGRLTDRIGRKPLLVFYYISLFTVPLMYLFASDFFQLAIYNAFLGLITAAGNTVVLTYLLDIVPEDQIGEFTAIYNMFLGVSYFAGSAFGGNVTQVLGTMFGRPFGIQTGYIISASGRLLTGLSFVTVTEKRSHRKP